MRNHETSDKLFLILIIMLIIGYISVNFLVKLPTFLILENISYAIAYSAIFLFELKHQGEGKHMIFLLTLLGFNIGRVSRSIISPSGLVGTLAFEHIPLLIFLFIVLVTALVKAYKTYEELS